MQNKPLISAIDLFCGVGGLTMGLAQSGIKVNIGVDIDPNCEYAYSINNKSKFLLKSVAELKGAELGKNFTPGTFRLMAGCAPCQTFSTYNQKASADDERWWLLSHFQRLVKETKPDFVTMENVPGLTAKDVFRRFHKSLKMQGYNLWFDIVDCAQYGIPQSRNRLVLLASKHGPIELITPRRYAKSPKTVRQAISHLKPIKAGDSDKLDPVHASCDLSDLNKQRILLSVPGGSWQDWPEEIKAECHKRESGKTYASVYGRMEWDKPSPTLTTQFYGFGSGRFGHPDQHRAISIREGAMLQTFPKNYKFFPSDKPLGFKPLGRLIGNAVPVKLGKVIGQSIIRHANSL
jgi:DNA (cytosine-5)-methyltransferase 1